MTKVLQLLEKDSSVLIHIINLYILAIKMYKQISGSSPLIMNEILYII